MNMQLHNLIAATATPLVTLGNPGAIYIQDKPNPDALIYQIEAAKPKTANVLLKELAGGSGMKAPTVEITNGLGEPSAVIRALGRLRSLALWGENWDGDGAPAPQQDAIGSAALMLGFLHSKLGKAPHVSLNGDGEPMLTMLDGEFEIAVTITSKTEAAYLIALGDDERGGLATFNERGLPAEIAAAVSELRPAAA